MHSPIVWRGLKKLVCLDHPRFYSPQAFCLFLKVFSMSDPFSDSDDEASRWVIQQDMGPLSGDDEREFLAWLQHDVAHQEAYLRAQKTWAAMSAPSITQALAQHTSAVAVIPKRRRRFGKARNGWAVAIAACLALGMYVGEPPVLLWWQASETSRVGEIRTVTLADGSQVQLDSDSAIAVHYTDKKREVRLLKGQAAFTVTPDREHPFVVTAENGDTTALGTRFIIKRNAALTDVTVTEHSVRVQAQGHNTLSEVIVHEGESATYGPQGVFAAHEVDVDTQAAWTRGRLVFVDQPLKTVINELARYHRGYITLINAEVGKLRVSGSFDATDPLAALDTLEHSMGLHITKVTNALIFIRK